ncbi:MAG: hypothetical protein ACRCY3_07050 [Sphingorhabdus sp.]
MPARFTPENWRRDGEFITSDYINATMENDEYFRIRGTNMQDLEPGADTRGENPWTDLWFYSNPMFIDLP